MVATVLTVVTLPLSVQPHDHSDDGVPRGRRSRRDSGSPTRRLGDRAGRHRVSAALDLPEAETPVEVLAGASDGDGKVEDRFPHLGEAGCRVLDQGGG